MQRLLGVQASYVRERSLANRVAQAKMPWQWTIDTFPFERQSGVNKAQVMGLADLDFVRRADNLVLIGGPGTGKTGIALGLLRQACVNGWAGTFLQCANAVRRVVFFTGRPHHHQAAHFGEPNATVGNR